MSSKKGPAHSPISPQESDSLSLGRIEISNDAIATIAARAAAKIKGIHVVGSSFRLTEILGSKEGSHKGVNVKTDGETGHVEIDVAVNVDYGVNIYETARQMQHIIKDEVEALTGTMPVEKVNVRVQQMVLREEEPPQPLSPDRAAPGGGEAVAMGERESSEE